MRIECVEQVELPFMLNLPTGEYPVGGEGGPYRLNVLQEQFVAHLDRGGCVIGDVLSIKQKLGGQHEVRHWQPLRTLVRHSTSVEADENGIPLMADDKLNEAMQSYIIGEDPMAFADRPEELQAEALSRIESLTEEELTQFRLRESVREFGWQLADAPLFVSHLNRLIRLYMTQFHDFFVEEVALHQLSSAFPLKGVFTTVFCNGEPIHFYGHVGKVPPLMFKPWQKFSESQLREFAERLAGGEQPDPINLMAMRSRYYLEKGAFRSAIVEASAALDLSLSTKIREGLRAKGQADNDITDFLRKPQNQRFEERAKAILQSATGTTVPALDNALWAEICKHRAVIRQGVTHSSAEPEKSEAEQVVNDFLRLAELIRQITV